MSFNVPVCLGPFMRLWASPLMQKTTKFEPEKRFHFIGEGDS